MTIIDDVLLNLIHISFPFLLYLAYIAYKKTVNDKENELALIITIFSTFYLTLKYNNQIFENIPMFLVNIPLIASYIKRNNIAIVISSIFSVLYYYNFSSDYLFIIIMVYIIIYILYKKIFDKIKYQNFILIFGLILMGLIGILNLTTYHNDINNYIGIIIVTINFLIIAEVLIILLKKVEEVLKIKISYKDIEYDKQVRTTLFHITHEIKNPIAVCKGYLDMFDIENKNHAKKYIPIMKEEINKTLNILEDFLSMNKIKLNKDLLDINYLLSDFIQNYEQYFKENKVKTDIELTDYEVYMDGDYNKLFQVLLNVIKNSIEASKENPKLKIWTEIKDNKFYIYVKDNGEGIPKDVIDKVGEPFFTTKINGTGLGVSLSRGIIESHGGTLSYESELGEYTKTIIMLPISEWY